MPVEKFTEHEKKELEEAIDDAFTTWTYGREETEFDASELFPMELWNIKVRTTKPTIEDFGVSSEKYPNDPPEELFYEAVEANQIEDAPKWHEDNPFKFRYKRLRKYFHKKFVEHSDRYSDLLKQHYEKVKTTDPDVYPLERTIVETVYFGVPIFSKKWFELKIYELFLTIEDDFIDKHPGWKQMHIGELGRMIEHYRWKFSYESDVKQGLKNYKARKAADNAKPFRAAERQVAMQECITRLWHEASEELGILAIRKDSNAAIAILSLAEKERPAELLIKSTGKLKGAETIRRQLPILRSMGKIN